jgi:hypothetical protein
MSIEGKMRKALTARAIAVDFSKLLVYFSPDLTAPIL